MMLIVCPNEKPSAGGVLVRWELECRDAHDESVPMMFWREKAGIEPAVAALDPAI
jgi:hypothetical protein